MVGVHTLSNFITTNDAVRDTPVPDPTAGASGIEHAGGGHSPRAQTEIPGGLVRVLFAQSREQQSADRRSIGEELVQYRAVSEDEPLGVCWMRRARRLRDTSRRPHAAGDEVALLADHAYNVFLTNAELGSEEMATNLAELFNETGLRQISFDGVEGNQSTGMGNYGEISVHVDVVRSAVPRHPPATTSPTPVAPRTTSGTSTRA